MLDISPQVKTLGNPSDVSNDALKLFALNFIYTPCGTGIVAPAPSVGGGFKKSACCVKFTIVSPSLFVRKADFAKVGELINQSHASLRDDYTVSCPELDTAVDAAKSAGALGSRMVGGGFGGSAIALIQASKTTETIKEIEKAFSHKGFKAPRFFTSLPSQGAELISRR